MKTITMPSFGADMAKGEVAHWNIKAGDKVKKGDIIASIETMKGLIDMEVFDDGVIEKLLVVEGTELAVGQPIAQLRLDNETLSDMPNQAIEPENSTTKKQPEIQQKLKIVEPSNIKTTTVQQDVFPPDKVNRIRISPAARQKAKELGINWRVLAQGQGPEGAIVLADIERAGTAKHDKQGINDPMRQAIEAVVSRSKQQIPHYYLQLDMQVDKAQQWITVHNQSLPSGQRILLNALIYSAIANALKVFPEFNGFYVDGKFIAAKSVHLGNVINLRQGGLVVAAIHDAQSLGCEQMMFKLKDQVIRAREGGLRMSEMQNATVTVSNLGERGCDTIQSIIFSPQVAIVGVGRQRTVPWIIDDKVTSASIVSITLAADHRVSDGHSGARLLNKINQLLQNPERLI